MEMAIPTTFEKFIDIVTDFGSKLYNTLHTLLGWGMFIMALMLSTFGVKAMLFHWILIAMAFDLFFGTWSSLKRKQFHISTALVSTAIKLVMYLVIFCIPMILEKILLNKDLLMGTTIVTAFICSAEFFSSIAHMLIIKPDFIVVKIFRKFLIAEVARKMKVSHEEVMTMFDIKKDFNKKQ
jgi:hypothetical protein